MPKGDSERKRQLDHDAQDLLAELGINPLDIEDIQQRYGRTYENTRYLIKRAREFGRANGIVIDRPIAGDGFLYRARWEWDGTQSPNWNVTLNDMFSRTHNMRRDMSTYVAHAQAEGNQNLTDVLEDIHDLFKVTAKSIAKARLLV